jgi:hypothetical protein
LKLTALSRRAVIAMAAAAHSFSVLAAAEDAALTITGSADGDVSFTMAELEAMPRHVIVTTTEFTDGPIAFAGPLARDVLRPPADASVAIMTALNDYAVEVPLDDLTRYDVVLAIRMDGAAMSRRDKGPIWLMYPMDDHDELRQPIYVNRLIWQLKSVAFK